MPLARANIIKLGLLMVVDVEREKKTTEDDSVDGYLHNIQIGIFAAINPA